MDKKTTGLSDNFKKNTAPKSFTKNPIKGTKYTIAISSAKGGVGKSTFATFKIVIVCHDTLYSDFIHKNKLRCTTWTKKQ